MLDLGVCDHALNKTLKIPRTFLYIQFGSYKRLFDPLFQEEVVMMDWGVVREFQDVDSAVELFQSMFTAILDKHAPYCQLKLLYNAPGWMTWDMISHINKCDFLSKKYKKWLCIIHLEMKLELIEETHSIAAHKQTILKLHFPIPQKTLKRSRKFIRFCQNRGKLATNILQTNENPDNMAFRVPVWVCWSKCIGDSHSLFVTWNHRPHVRSMVSLHGYYRCHRYRFAI